MYLKTNQYEQLAFTTVRKAVVGARKIKADGLTPAKFDTDHAIDQAFPAKWEDDWTRHNETKLRKFIDLEIRSAKAGLRTYGE